MKKSLTLLAALCSFQLIKAQAGFSVSTQLCSNAVTTLTASTGAMSNCTYTWSAQPAGANFSAANSSVTNVSFSMPGSYSLVLTISSGTLISALQAAVDVFSPPSISVAASGYTTCITGNFPVATKPVSLTASGCASYTWVPPNASLPLITGSLNTVSPGSSSCFSVSGTSTVGCTSATAICITVVPQFTIAVTPSFTFICLTGTGNPDIYVDMQIIQTQLPFGQFYSYTWSGPALITSSLIPTVRAVPLATSHYTAEAHDNEGCVSRPATVTVSVVTCTGLQESSVDDPVAAYPNPTTGKLFFSTHNSESGVALRIYNSLGEMVMDVARPEPCVDLSDLPDGVYSVQAATGNTRRTFKVVKQ